MKEAGDRIVVGDVAERALIVSQAKFPGSELMTVIAPEGRDVKRMNELAHGSVALRPKLCAGDRNNFVPLLAPTKRVIVGHQEVGQNQSAAGMRRKRRRSGIAGLRARQYG